MSVKWVFDPVPPSGKRTGGNAAEYSFEGRIDILVRELTQNALDARAGDDRPVEIRFRLVELSGDRLQVFLEAVDWDSLSDNLRAVPSGRGGAAIARALDDLERRGRLRLLVVEDRCTRGLEGTEQRTTDQETNSFCALVRDELYSDKGSRDAGGSFGLGKSVLWAYSSIKTVLFSSVPISPPPPHTGIRFIGRTSLPYHETDIDGACTGDGWLGVARDPGTRDRKAESLWGAEAQQVATDACCVREVGESGLSAVIVGFAEPGEEDREAPELIEAIKQSLLESFWPAMVRGWLKAEVRHEMDDELVSRSEVAVDDGAYSRCADLLRAYDHGELTEVASLEAEQSAFRMVKLDLPERRLEGDSHPACEAECALLVKLLGNNDTEDAIRDRIFRFRGPGMVVRSERRRNLSIAARPYLAILVAGRAAGDSEHFHRAECFLRAAEPPAHDQWTHNTRRIKDEYVVHGCKAKLDRFERAIREALAELISQPERRGGALPDSILRHLRFGQRGGGGNPRFLAVTRQTAKVVGNSWSFSASCRRVRPDGSPWHVRVRIKYAKDGGGGDDIHAIASVESPSASTVEVRNGVGWLEFPPSVERATILGTTDPDHMPAIGVRGAIVLRVDGALGGVLDA